MSADMGAHRTAQALRIIDWNCLSPADRTAVLRRPAQRDAAAVIAAARQIIDAVRHGGDDAALRRRAGR
jgi:predicted Fe-S protein YdhL (DUF1289 family)